MKPELVNQPSVLPTRKLAVAAMIGPTITEIWGGVMLDVYPPLAGDVTSMLVGGLAALVVGYFTRDRANVKI